MTKIHGVKIIHEENEIETSIATKNEVKAKVGAYVIWWYKFDLTIYEDGMDVLYIRSVFWDDRLSEIDLVSKHVKYRNYMYPLSEKI